MEGNDMDKFEVKELIQYFENRQRRRNEFGMDTFDGEGPKYPMAVIYMGEDAAKAHKEIGRILSRIWPPYKDEICFLDMQVVSDQNVEFYEVGDRNQICSDAQISSMITSLFSANTHFSDRSNIMVFFILDTSGIHTAEEFKIQVDAVKAAKGKLLANNQMIMLNILLNEDFTHAEEAKQIRNAIGEMFYGQTQDTSHIDSTFLISNRRNDNIIFEWDVCYRMLADIMVLADNSDTRIATVMFNEKVKTLGYALAEKPLEKIAQVVVSTMIRRIAKYQLNTTTSNLLFDDELDKKLGITPEGTLFLLDQYAEKELIMRLPSLSQLEYFPRSTSDDIDPIEKMSYAKFDELTMGAWSCFLEQIIQRADAKVSTGKRQSALWKEEYQKQLKQNFTADELVMISENQKTLTEKFGAVRVAGGSGDILSTAKANLRYRLSSNESLIQLFIEALMEQAEKEKKFIEAWSHLASSMGTMFGVGDQNLAAYYEKSTNAFFDRNDKGIKDKFQQLKDVEELWEFLTYVIDQIINNDGIYSAPFENELQERLNAAADPKDARSYIRRQLTGSEVHVYLHVSMALDRPLISTMILRQDTPLCSNLRANLDETTCYYNAGCGDAAEAIEVYVVEQTNLIM